MLRVRDGIPLRVGRLASVRRGAGARARDGVLPRQAGGDPQRPEAARREHARPDAARSTGSSTICSGLCPAGVVIEKENFRQADFIEIAIHNVSVALRDGAVLVLVILFLFLGNLRTTLISALAIPLSLVAGVLVISLFGGTLNTMTLGGFTIAIGALVDDAIIDVENVFRRLREERASPQGSGARRFEVVFQASSEVRDADSLRDPGHRARLPAAPRPARASRAGCCGRSASPTSPSLAGSLVVALTVTPVLCLLLLPREGAARRARAVAAAPA